MALDIHLKVVAAGGTEIKGKSKRQGHEDQIEVISFSIGATQTGSFHAGGDGGGSGKVEFTDLTIMKNVDDATPLLMQHCASGKHLDKVELFVDKAGDPSQQGKQFTYYKVIMTKAIVSSMHNTGDGGGDMLGESVTFNAANIRIEHIQQQADGSPGKETAAEYNIQEARVIE